MRTLATYFLLFAVLNLTAQNTFTINAILRSNAQTDTMCDGRVLPIFAITSGLNVPGKIPAKILYCNEGDSVIIKAKSISQNEHHTIHLHGLDVDTQNDGDPSTSFWLSHMQEATYKFRATHAGTYLYHCHAADVVHVQMGMYGMIVVRAAGGAKTAWTGGPAFSKDWKWLMSEVDSVWHYHEPVHDTLMDTVNIPKYVPHYFLINGKCGSEISSDDSIRISGAQGEPLLMRLANIGYLTNRIIFPSFMNAQIIDSDGRPLPQPIVNDTCYIMPGERFSVMLQASSQSTGVATVQYLDMNTGSVVQSDAVPITINGVIGLSELNAEEALFKAYPNPGHGVFQLEVLEPGPVKASVYNLLGQLVFEKQFIQKTEIDLSAFPEAVYSLVLHAGGYRKLGAGKLIIAR